jgi:phosphoribosyl-ATP pyrophosphohydrolase/phosphoribosyl-AMP cyclohydrolase/histidinol dehydrogenase
LEHTLQQRLESAPEGSYTKRLFDDEALLRSKLIEEAIELSEARTKKDVAEEAADVLYFAMVACAKKGVVFR